MTISSLQKLTLAGALAAAFALAPAIANADSPTGADDPPVVDDGGQIPVDPVPVDGVPVGAPGDDGVVTTDDGTPVDPIIYQMGGPEVQRDGTGTDNVVGGESQHSDHDTVWASKPGHRSLFGSNSPWREWLNKKH